jgi:polysaccharide biosynthesis/export protein
MTVALRLSSLNVRFIFSMMKIAYLTTLFSVLILLCSCESRPTTTIIIPPPADGKTRTAESYTLVDGDQVRLSYYKNSSLPSDTPYRLGVGDQLKITVENRPEFTNTVQVLPDGTMTLPVVGVIKVGGKTINECSEDISKGFATRLTNPRVDVIVQRASAQLDEVYSGLTAAQENGGQQLLVENNHLHPPLLTSINVAGRTVAEVRNEIVQSYRALQPGLGVAFALMKRHERSIMVAGEVKHSGRFVITEPVSVITAMTLAGGATDRATLSQVIIASALPDGSVSVTQLDLSNSFAGTESTGWTTMVPDNSVVYVPISYISNLNIFVDQYIRLMIPIQLSAGVYFPVGN